MSDIFFEEIQGSDEKSVHIFFKVLTGLFLAALVFNLIIQKTEIDQDNYYR